jgi:hypothetical protein
MLSNFHNHIFVVYKRLECTLTFEMQWHIHNESTNQWFLTYVWLIWRRYSRCFVIRAIFFSILWAIRASFDLANTVTYSKQHSIQQFSTFLQFNLRESHCFLICTTRMLNYVSIMALFDLITNLCAAMAWGIAKFDLAAIKVKLRWSEQGSQVTI